MLTIANNDCRTNARSCWKNREGETHGKERKGQQIGSSLKDREGN